MSVAVLSGLFVGLVYGLLAMGLVITYRTSRVVNFAYGEIGMLAAFVYFDIRLGTEAARLGTPVDHGIVVALPVALGLGALLGAAVELFVVRPLRNGPTVNALVGTIGAGLLFLTFAVRRWGADVRPAKPLVDGDGVRVLGLTVSPSQLLIAACTLAVIVGLALLYRFTSAGIRLRATALDPYAAALSGVNTNTTSLATWAGAGALSALSAVLIGPIVAMNVFFMTLFALRAFAAALLGGLTSIGGAFLGGLVLGIAESVIAYKSPVRGMTEVLLAVAILVVTTTRPGGLMRTEY